VAESDMLNRSRGATSVTALIPLSGMPLAVQNPCDHGRAIMEP
jgi:hypothetical protein